MYRWQLLIKEYGPEIIYIKGIDNTVADAISRLDYNPDLNHHADDEEMSEGAKWNNILTLLNYYQPEDCDEQNNNYKQNYSLVLANNQSDDEIYPLTIAEIADAQRTDSMWKYSLKRKTPKEKFLQ